jgi:type IV pilus assembly protein PilN
MRDINFFSHYIGKKQQMKNSKIYLYGLISVAALLIIVSFGINTTNIYLLNKSISSYNDKLIDSENQVKFKEAENVNKKMDILKQYDLALKDVSTSVKNRDNVSDKLLKEINSTLPSKVLVKNLEVVENTVFIKGTSTDRSAVAQFKYNLSKLTVMTDVYVNYINTQNAVEGEYSFDIKCLLKEVE